MSTSENHLQELDKEIQALDNIVFKGYRSGLMLIIPETGRFEDHLSELERHLEKAQSFFDGAKVSLQLGNRQLTAQQQTELIRLFQKKGLILRTPSERGGLLKRLPGRRTQRQRESLIPTVTLNKTLRSGQRIEFEGNVLVLGDVNPGAEVIASGDIIVLGKLRGTAHAGASGNQAAYIFAFQIHPVQLRIAGVIGRESEKVKRNRERESIHPEIARVKGEQIVVEDFYF